MANYCWNYVVFNGKATQIKKLRNKFKQYDKTNWFVEFGDYVLNKGKLGVTKEEIEKKIEKFNLIHKKPISENQFPSMGCNIKWK